MKLTLQSETGDVISIRIEGRVSQRDVEVNDPLVDALGENVYGRQLSIDLSEVSALDSSGVNWLLVAQKRMHQQGGKLVLHSLSPIANNVLKVLNLHSVFQIADCETEAMRKFGGDA